MSATKIWIGLLLTLAPVPATASDTSGLSWKKAKPGWTYEFPRDEFAHPDFKTEWWYFTGNLETKSGRRFGYQLTFFRQGVRPPANRPPVDSQFVADHIWFAHFAISDIDSEHFHHTEKFSRGAFEQAGSQPAAADDRVVWIDDWSLRKTDEAPGHYTIEAATDAVAIKLELDTTKPAVFHGTDGFSPKSADVDSASHYYSFTRLQSKGTARIGDRDFAVAGSSWYDREWSTSALSRDQAGWDWFAIQLDDGSDLMLFQLRDPNGATNFASGTFVGADGKSRSLSAADIKLTPTKSWTAPDSKVAYPIDWRVEIPKLDLSLNIAAAQPNQQLLMAAMTYWEGATTIIGKKKGRAVTGRGYLELTGYDGKMTPLSQ